MKNLVYILILLCIARPSVAQQNLVPNPGFEQYTNCPDVSGQFEYPPITTPYPAHVKYWHSAVYNSPDYYNACSGNIYSSVPANFYGHHPAHSGSAYAGIIIYLANGVGQVENYVEYIEVKLDSALRAGQRYLVSCYVHPAFYRDANAGNNVMAAQYINIGFTANQRVQPSPPLLVLDVVSMYNQQRTFLDDTTGWQRIHGYYTARGGEQWLIMGTFYNKYPPQKQIFPHTPMPGLNYVSYYMVDDVSVTTALPCDTQVMVHDTLTCAFPAKAIQIRSSGTGSLSFRWNTGDTGRILNVNKGGTYWCLATGDCNATIDTYRVSFFRDTSAISIDILSCDSTRTLSGKDSADRWLWSTGETTQNITVHGYGSFTCTSIVKCTMFVNTYDIGPLEVQEKDVSLGNDTSVCANQPVTVGRQYDFSLKYQWNTGDTTCCISVDKSGEYVLTAKDECYTYTDTQSVSFRRCHDCLVIPDAFSPNGDGINDLFGIIALCDIKDFTIQIFNRWGQLYYSSSNPAARWNGFYRADYAEQGVYYYMLEYTEAITGKRERIKGNLTLIK